jgi:hypothetical protein
MADPKGRQISGKTIGIVIIAGIVIATLSTVVQHLILGKAHAAITGGVVGGAMAAMALTVMRKTSK